MNNKEEVSAGRAKKLKAEQTECLSVINRANYSADEVEWLLSYLNKTNLPDFITSIDVHIMHYLSAVTAMDETEIGGLYNLFSLNRTLTNIAQKGKALM